MTDADAIADEIAKSLDRELAGEQKDDILRAFGFIISAMALDCPCANIDDSLDIVRAAADKHFAIAKQARQ
jgi:hypothetical protein